MKFTIMFRSVNADYYYKLAVRQNIEQKIGEN